MVRVIDSNLPSCTACCMLPIASQLPWSQYCLGILEVEQCCHLLYYCLCQIIWHFFGLKCQMMPTFIIFNCQIELIFSTASCLTALTALFSAPLLSHSFTTEIPACRKLGRLGKNSFTPCCSPSSHKFLGQPPCSHNFTCNKLVAK